MWVSPGSLRSALGRLQIRCSLPSPGSTPRPGPSVGAPPHGSELREVPGSPSPRRAGLDSSRSGFDQGGRLRAIEKGRSGRLGHARLITGALTVDDPNCCRPWRKPAASVGKRRPRQASRERHRARSARSPLPSPARPVARILDPIPSWLPSVDSPRRFESDRSNVLLRLAPLAAHSFTSRCTVYNAFAGKRPRNRADPLPLRRQHSRGDERAAAIDDRLRGRR